MLKNFSYIIIEDGAVACYLLRHIESEYRMAITDKLDKHQPDLIKD